MGVVWFYFGVLVIALLGLSACNNEQTLEPQQLIVDDFLLSHGRRVDSKRYRPTNSVNASSEMLQRCE
jgi:hypothetical protein